MKGYNHKDIEKKWREKWEEIGLYKTEDEAKTEDLPAQAGGSPKENFYALVEFPYPSGNLHIGHWYAFAVPDIFARFKRMQGFNVLYPIGFDSFGLPAENAAIKRGLDPKEWTYSNIEYMTGQLKRMGNMFDWTRKVVTSDPEYYKWTQWLFLELFKKGLAYKKKGLVNWCPSCQTVLANEQVVDGVCERCSTEVVKKELEQWYFKITDYAEKLLHGLEKLDWPEPIKESQRNWIGKSEGAEYTFTLTTGEEVPVFTTRADTLFGVTYIVLAPEHSLVRELLSQIENTNEVEAYIKQAQTKTEIERTDFKKEKTGIELKGIKARHPATGEEVSVWIADYVLNQYGTGAVMAVPAHDERDFQFAKKYDLPIKQVVVPRLIDKNNPHVPGKEVVFRDAIIAVVRNPHTDTYLCLEWKKHPWITFVMGGMEENEDPIMAAKREILEETGYKNIKFIKDLGFAQSEFFAAHKDVNRIAHTRNLLFELENEEQDQISDDELEIHSVTWRTREEIARDDMTHSEMPLILENLDGDSGAYTDDGILIDSDAYSRLGSIEAREKIAERYGVKKTTYKLRDWLLSRQRYWGCPIPIVYDPEGKPHAVPEEHLPWRLPTDDIDLTPKGTSPLGSSKEFLERTEKIFGLGWKPEVDTMDTFVDSSWYFLRYADPHNPEKFADKEKLKQWMPVTRYSGGAEHTTMHLLYARFFQHALYDLNLVLHDEPFQNRMNRGLILGPDGNKMSKSKGNVIDPEDHVETVGADTVKMYLAFIGPYNEVGQYPWDLGGIAGIRRFLEKVWLFYSKEDGLIQYSPSVEKNQEIKLHQMIKAVTEDIEKYKFNTAIASMMKFVGTNGLLREDKQEQREVREIFLKLLAPFAPYLAEELWEKMGHKHSVHLEEWPPYEAHKIKASHVTYAIQINGKTRGTTEVPEGLTEDEIIQKAKEESFVVKYTEGKEVIKNVFIPGRLINFVVKD